MIDLNTFVILVGLAVSLTTLIFLVGKPIINLNSTIKIALLEIDRFRQDAVESKEKYRLEMRENKKEHDLLGKRIDTTDKDLQSFKLEVNKEYCLRGDCPRLKG